MINIKENEDLSKLNHSCAHLLAQAVKHLYPNAKFWVGPVIEEGFYYDIDLGDEVIKEEDLPKIEKEMKKLSKDGKRIVRHEISKDEALEMFHDDPYKIDLISRMDENEQVISCYTQGDFTDLCRGPHVDTTKELKYILGYFSKNFGYTDPNKFAFDENNQYILESIMYSAMTLYSNGGASRTKLTESHRRWEAMLNSKKEEKLTRTQELNTAKIRALRELGYDEIDKNNASEVLDKIAEIMAQKF